MKLSGGIKFKTLLSSLLFRFPSFSLFFSFLLFVSQPKKKRKKKEERECKREGEQLVGPEVVDQIVVKSWYRFGISLMGNQTTTDVTTQLALVDR